MSNSSVSPTGDRARGSGAATAAPHPVDRGTRPYSDNRGLMERAARHRAERPLRPPRRHRVPCHVRLALTWTGLLLVATTAVIGAWLIATSISLRAAPQPSTVTEQGQVISAPRPSCASVPTVYSQLPPCRFLR